MRSVFTPLLLHEMQQALGAGKQVILFQNRRGYSSFIQCGTCGWIPRCNHCDVSLTYHRNPPELLCHYCGNSRPVPPVCGECGSSQVGTKGFGTELVEDDIELIFPGVGVGRLDLDSSRSRRSYEKILADFAEGKTRILVGTQMLSKGLDFDKVSLVGILNADQMLNYPDFRAYERSFQLMAQVSGRSGRKDTRGKVVIQASDPGHPILRQVRENDFEGMYREQLVERQAFSYPPFVRLVKFDVKGKESRDVDIAAGYLAARLREAFGKRVLGPQAPPVARIKNYYIRQILLKIEKNASFSKARTIIRQVLDEASGDPVFKKVRISPDVDPA
jgi:primosomal protein N' (replication factor Y)